MRRTCAFSPSAPNGLRPQELQAQNVKKFQHATTSLILEHTRATKALECCGKGRKPQHCHKSCRPDRIEILCTACTCRVTVFQFPISVIAEDLGMSGEVNCVVQC